MTDSTPTTPGPMVDALQALRLLIRCVRSARSNSRPHETASQRIALDGALDRAEEAEQAARFALLGGSHSGLGPQPDDGRGGA